jgi:hypothetical protein
MDRHVFAIGCTVLLLWASASPSPAQMFNSQQGQPTMLQPIQPQRGMTMPGMQGNQNPNNFWNGMPMMQPMQQQQQQVQAAGSGLGGRFGTTGRGVASARSPQATAAQNPGNPQAGSLSVMQMGRFLRGNRTAGDFVGSDAADASHFVGAEDSAATPLQPGAAAALGAAALGGAALGAAASRVQGGLPLLGQQLGAGLGGPAPRATMYEPRLRVDFAVPSLPPQQVQANLTDLLESCTELRRMGPIAVSLEGRTATLRGTVASERDRLLAQQLILFEPGISQVANELRVRSPAAGQSEGPAAP